MSFESTILYKLLNSDITDYEPQDLLSEIEPVYNDQVTLLNSILEYSKLNDDKLDINQLYVLLRDMYLLEETLKRYLYGQNSTK